MFIIKFCLWVICCLCLCLRNALAYDLNGVATTFNFGSPTPPFADITLLNSNICVGYTVLLEASNYYVRVTSSNSTTTAFQMKNTTNSAYTLNYSVAWAGSTGGSPVFTSLSSGQNSSITFPAQLLGGLTCLLLPANASMQLKLLATDQTLAKQGTYTDTLTILIVSS